MKKFLAIALVLVLSIGMMIPVTAAAKVEFSGFNPASAADFEAFRYLTSDDAVRPGDTIDLKGIGFTNFTFKNIPTGHADIDAYINAQGTNAKSYALRLAKTLTFRVRARKGPTVIDEIKISDAYPNTDATPHWRFDIQFKTINPYVSVDVKDFETDIYFVLGGRTDNTWYSTLSGEFGNRIEEVDADYIEFDTWDGVVVKATEYVPKIALKGNQDEDIWAHVRMTKNQKIYFDVVNDGDSKDAPIFDKYPSIDHAYTVRSVGLSSYTGNIIEMAGVDSTYYVYGKNADGTLKYLGRGGELLPYSAKYYVSTTKLDLDEDIDEELPDETGNGGGYNPPTGI